MIIPSDIETLPAEPKFYDAPSVTLTCVLKSKDLAVSGVKWMKNSEIVKAPAFTVTAGSDPLTSYLSINEVTLISLNFFLLFKI